MGCTRAVCERHRHLVADGAMRENLTVVPTPLLHLLAGIVKRQEPMGVPACGQYQAVSVPPAGRFFEAQPLGMQEKPDGSAICLDAPGEQLRRQTSRCEWLLSTALAQPHGRLARQTWLLVCPPILPWPRELVSALSLCHLEMQDGLIFSANPPERIVSPASKRASARASRSSE